MRLSTQASPPPDLPPRLALGSRIGKFDERRSAERRKLERSGLSQFRQGFFCGAMIDVQSVRHVPARHHFLSLFKELDDLRFEFFCDWLRHGFHHLNAGVLRYVSVASV